jgi:predicted ribonuclease toxin of YeeF-YezG toxin-antitoxin module
MDDYAKYFDALQSTNSVNSTRRDAEGEAQATLQESIEKVTKTLEPFKEIGDGIAVHYAMQIGNTVANKSIGSFFEGSTEAPVEEAPEEIEMDTLGETTAETAGETAGVISTTASSYAFPMNSINAGLDDVEAIDTTAVTDTAVSAAGTAASTAASTASTVVGSVVDAASATADAVGTAVSGAVSATIDSVAASISAIPAGAVVAGLLIIGTSIVDALEGKRHAHHVNIPVLNPSAQLGVGD